MDTSSALSFRGPHAGILAVVYVAVFCAGLLPVTVLGGTPYFPSPTASISQIVAFFSTRQSAVLLCAFFQFGSAIPLGIFTATIVSQLRFLGVRAAGTHIALFGGFATSIGMLFSACFLWAMTFPGIAQDATLLNALYRISFGMGGPGFSVPFGILIAGIAVTAGLGRLIPRWMMYLGLAIAICGVLSWFEIVNDKLIPLIPLTRFPGFLWTIIVGLYLPRKAPLGSRA